MWNRAKKVKARVLPHYKSFGQKMFAVQEGFLLQFFGGT